MFAAFPRHARKPPPAAAFIAPSNPSSAPLLRHLIGVAGDITATYSNNGRWPRLHRRNVRFLIRAIDILRALFECLLLDSDRPLPRSERSCLNEFYIFIHRSRFLLDYCFRSSRLWVVLLNNWISDQFYDLQHEISTLFDVLPLSKLGLPTDMREHVDLLRRQMGTSRPLIDGGGEDLRLQLLSFVHAFEKKRPPDLADLKAAFLDQIGVLSAGDLEAEIRFLEDQICCPNEPNAEADSAAVAGIIAVARYCKILFFGVCETRGGKKKAAEPNSVSVPNDFCCPISLELMSDPVVVSSGQTYERGSIERWMAGGKQTCPNSGQNLITTDPIPNLALRSLISSWCAENRVPCSAKPQPASSSPAVAEATRAAARVLIQHLSAIVDTDSNQAAAAELGWLSKSSNGSRAIVAEEGAIPLLARLLCSGNPAAQETAVSALLSLSVEDSNKRRMVEEDRCLESIVKVLGSGATARSREIAAAALLRLSALRECKVAVAGQAGCTEGLAGVLRYGSAAGRRDAVMALFNLSMHPECSKQVADSGAAGALVGALADERLAEAAAGALALLLRRATAGCLAGREYEATVRLAGIMRKGSEVGRENAAAALHEICRTGCPAPFVGRRGRRERMRQERGCCSCVDDDGTDGVVSIAWM